jgi:ABC-2 type transport system permease protein
MSARASGQALPFLAGARRVLRLALDGRAWTRRGLFVGLLLGLPVLLGVMVRSLGSASFPARASGAELFDYVVRYYYLAAACPLTALFSAASLVSEELEGKTITYLFTRPVTRASILVGKLASYLVQTLTLALPAVVLAFFLFVSMSGFSALGAHAGALGRALIVTALALLAYGALFALAGVLLRRPLVLGLLLFAWERLAYAFGPGYLPRLTFTAHLHALLGPGAGAPASAAVLLGVTAALVLAAVFVFTRREYVLDQ